MKSYCRTSLILGTLLTILSCSGLKPDEEVVYLYTGNSSLPVYIRGRPNARKYIIWTHGGPGSSGLYYGDIPEIAVLHSDYRVIYWDQMGSGGSTGNPSKEDYTINTLSDHLDGIIKLVNNRYSPEQLFLLGHSWGGFLTSWYLVAEGDEKLSQQRQQSLDGLVLLNPILDIQRAIKDGIDYIKGNETDSGYAASQIDAGIETDKWKAVLEWYNEHVVDGLLYGDDVATHFQYIEDAGGMLVDRDRNDQLVWELGSQMILISPFHFIDYYTNQKTVRTWLDISDKTLADPTQPNISLLNVPTLMLAGEDDKLAFNYMSREWFNLLGTEDETSTDKTLIMYDKCAHAAFLDQPESISRDLVDFLETR